MDELATAFVYLVGTPFAFGVAWIVLTLLGDWLDGGDELGNRPALILGGTMMIPVVVVGAAAGLVLAIVALTK